MFGNMNVCMMHIAELEELRMTKAELAKALGIKPSTVYKWKKIPEYVEGYLLLMKELRDSQAVLHEDESRIKEGPLSDKPVRKIYYGTP